MPLPSPKKKEKQGDFISRCAGDSTMNKDFKDTKQRVAVCYSQWKKAKASAFASFGEGENEVLFNLECPECVEAAQKTYSGTKRSELKDTDFLFPKTRSFPIVSPQDVRDAINNFGRMKSGMSYDAFIKLLYKKARSKGQAFVDAIPESTKKEHKLTATLENEPGEGPEHEMAEGPVFEKMEDMQENENGEDEGGEEENGCENDALVKEFLPVLD